MFYVSRRAMRGRRGKSLILSGVVIFAIGLVITIGTYAFASSRGGGTYIVSWGPMAIGIIAIVRGISQSIRDRNAVPVAPGPQPGYNQPGVPPGYQQPGYQQPGYGQAAPGQQPAYDQPAYDQPGYAQPRYGQGVPGHEPGYQEPVYQEPVYNQPGYGQPGHNMPDTAPFTMPPDDSPRSPVR